MLTIYSSLLLLLLIFFIFFKFDNLIAIEPTIAKVQFFSRIENATEKNVSVMGIFFCHLKFTHFKYNAN